MAIVYGSFSNYVESDYVATGYVEGQPIAAAFVTNSTGELVTTGQLVEAEVSITASTSTAVAAGKTLAATSTMSLTTTNSTGADLTLGSSAEIGLLTGWSAQSSPIRGTTLTISSSTTITTLGGFNQISSAALAIEFDSTILPYSHRQRTIIIELQ